jgi:hypothetical protein
MAGDCDNGNDGRNNLDENAKWEWMDVVIELGLTRLGWKRMNLSNVRRRGEAGGIGMNGRVADVTNAVALGIGKCD